MLVKRYFSVITVFILISLFLSGCSKSQEDQNARTQNDYLIMPTQWMQNAGEYRALCYQTYAFAGTQLDAKLTTLKKGKKPAIILDLDETVLDNTPYEAHVIQNGLSYPTDWQKWCDLAKAQTVPGASGFLKYAAAKGVEIFYISNRRENTRKGTVKNLQNLNLPNADNAHVFLQKDESSKESRRQMVFKEHEVLLFFGDNLLDFAADFERKNAADRNMIVDSLRSTFGNRFIVLPNPMYGDWDSAVLNYKRSSTIQENNKRRIEALRGF